MTNDNPNLVDVVGYIPPLMEEGLLNINTLLSKIWYKHLLEVQVTYLNQRILLFLYHVELQDCLGKMLAGLTKVINRY